MAHRRFVLHRTILYDGRSSAVLQTHGGRRTEWSEGRGTSGPPASGFCWSWSGGEGVELAELAYTQVILLAPGAVAREADASRLCHHDQQRHAPIRICYRLGRDAFGQCW